MQQPFKWAGEARHPGIAKCSVVTERELAKSSGGVGPSWSRAYGMNSAATSAVKSAGIVKCSVTSESESELADDLGLARVALQQRRGMW